MPPAAPSSSATCSTLAPPSRRCSKPTRRATSPASCSTGGYGSVTCRRRELAARSGTPLPEVLETYRLLGVPVPDPDAPAFVAREARLFELLAAARPALPEGMTDEILRSIGEALTLVAESGVSAFVGSVEDLLEEGSPRARAEVTTATGEVALELGSLLEPLLRHHLWAAVQRQRAAMRTSMDRRESHVVGRLRRPRGVHCGDCDDGQRRAPGVHGALPSSSVRRRHRGRWPRREAHR